MSGVVVIACYRPKPDREQALLALTRTHVPRLRAAGLATDREPMILVAEDGTVVEVFEWVSQDAIDQAHAHPDVLQMWSEYEAVCDYVPITAVPGAADLFPGFRPID